MFVKLNSQQDMFDSDEPAPTPYLVLFEWTVDRNPFNAYPRDMFSKTEIMDRWLESILDNQSRKKQLPSFSRLPMKIFSFFGKMNCGKDFCLIKLYISFIFQNIRVTKK